MPSVRLPVRLVAPAIACLVLGTSGAVAFAQAPNSGAQTPASSTPAEAPAIPTPAPESLLGNVCDVHLVNGTDATLRDLVYHKWATDDWETVPSAPELDPGQDTEWRSRGGDFRGCYNFVGYNLYPPQVSAPSGVNLLTTDPWGDSRQDPPIASCLIGDSVYVCKVTEQSRQLNTPGGHEDGIYATWVITRA